MNIYSKEIMIAGTVYIKAQDQAEAQTKFNSIKETVLELPDTLLESIVEIPISGRRFNDPELPEISLSPAMTLHGDLTEDEPMDLVQKDIDKDSEDADLDSDL